LMVLMRKAVTVMIHPPRAREEAFGWWSIGL
jgi:hypothetical protein